ncbi:hypothetical protein ACLEEJ_00445 [Lonsdalea quercina]|uniref:hypothetical protein n=1 Tax=Lonsdalea quercina TaxID=71657 RepID=UPI0039764D52
MKPSIIDLTTKLSAATMGINNVSDALGLSGDGAFSHQVITKFTDLQADNETLRAMVHELTAQRDSMAPGGTKAAKMGNEKITPLTIKRDEYGYWTHPDYDAYFDWCEHAKKSEYDQWLKEIGMELVVVCLEYDDESPAQIRYFEYGDMDVHDWEPTKPEGEDWFIVSIHDTDDGPVCIWMREAK